ncbi:TIGR02391 family protein [Actinomadura meyerae]|uniref:TIGR02391 family protein n=1 Tax=Actinomadura meyerae TaxID=240840 RepID=UPI001C5310FF|nr:TIGR02391 family protein [Actinomadura meyerae]
MISQQAVVKLQELRKEAQEQGVQLNRSGTFASWKGRVQSVLTRSLGVDHHLVIAFSAVKYTPGMWTEGSTQTYFDRSFEIGLREACGLIDAAIFELEDAGTSDEAVDETAFDPDLWAHVQRHVQNEDWQTVASQTAIFVEDRVRQWCGNPMKPNGQSLVGKGLFGKVFADDAQFRLGKESGEWEGWRMLGMGFAQALGNVDRHNIQKRDDAKRYAFGVLGTGSLILTQLRHQHGDDLSI